LALHPDFGLALHLLNLDQTVRSAAPVLGGQPCFWHWHLDSRGVLVHVNLGERAAQLTHVRWRDPARPSIQPIDIHPGHFQAPAISPDGRQLAYAQLSHTGESQLVVVSRERKHIIGEHSGLAALNWSPRAERLAFIHPLVNANSHYGPLHLWQSDDEHGRRLSSENVVAFFWAPDGERIAYLTVVNDPAPVAIEQASNGANGHVKGSWPFLQIRERETIRLAVHILDVRSGSDHQVAIFTPSQPFLRQFLPFFDQYAKSHAIWSPASDALVLPAEVNGRVVILVIDLDAEEVRAITTGVMATWSW
jgi:TolB protein